jgi:hypothetical protein
MKIALVATIAAVAGCLAASSASAYVDVELTNGRHVIGDSYTDAGVKLIVYRPLGAVEVDSATVRAVHEKDGAMPSDRQSTVAAPSAPSSPSSPVVASLSSTATGPEERAQEITQKLFEVYRFRFAAQNRGDQQAFQKYDKEAKQLEQERAAARSKAKSETGKSETSERR